MIFSNMLKKGLSRWTTSKKEGLLRNIISSILYKGGNIAVQLILVRVTLKSLSADHYGFWLVLSSLLMWFNIFDLGFVNGLRNKLTAAIADQDFNRAKEYVSTTYAAITFIFLGVFLLSLFITPFLDWQRIFNVYFIPATEVTAVTILTFGFFCMRLAMLPVNAVLFATHQAAKTELINFLTNAATLAFMLLLMRWPEKASLLYVSVIYGMAPVIVLIIATLSVFYGRLQSVRPSWQYVNLKTVKDLGGLGGSFFLLQLISLIFFSTQQFLIVKLFDATQVTVYSLAYRYLSLVNILANVVMAPYWSGITEAAHQQNFAWIRGAVANMQKLWLGLAILTVLMVAGSNTFYYLWLDNTSPPIPFEVTVAMALSVIIMAWNALYSTVLNAFGKIKLQIAIASVMAVGCIPMAIYLSSTLKLGLVGISLSTILCMIPGMILQPVQYQRIVRSGNRT